MGLYVGQERLYTLAMGQQREDPRWLKDLLHLLMRTVGGMIRARSLAGVLAACTLLGTGCSSTGERVVFTVATGFSNRATARTTDLVDIGLPDLRNQSGQTVTLRHVSLVSAPNSAHIRMVTGYLHSQTHVDVLGFALGNFVKHCRRQMTPYRLPSIV